MCHSVDMYMPEASRRAAEERIVEGRAAAAAREQRVVDAALRLTAWLKRRLGRTPAHGVRAERIRAKAMRAKVMPAGRPMREMVEHG